MCTVCLLKMLIHKHKYILRLLTLYYIFPNKVGPDTELSSSELLTLSCGVLFFLSFFVAMYVEVKAELTIYQVGSCSLFREIISKIILPSLILVTLSIIIIYSNLVLLKDYKYSWTWPEYWVTLKDYHISRSHHMQRVSRVYSRAVGLDTKLWTDPDFYYLEKFSQSGRLFWKSNFHLIN